MFFFFVGWYTFFSLTIPKQNYSYRDADGWNTRSGCPITKFTKYCCLDSLRNTKSAGWTASYVSRWKTILHSVAGQVSQVSLYSKNFNNIINLKHRWHEWIYNPWVWIWCVFEKSLCTSLFSTNTRVSAQWFFS